MDKVNQPDWDETLNLRVGVTIYPEQDKAIGQVLAELKERCPAQFILLADTSGQLVSIHGERGTTDIVGLSALIAGDMAASQEIAMMTGQYQSYQLVLREGKQVSTFVAEAGKYLLLFVQVSAEIPLGWARLLIRETGRQVGLIVETPPEVTEKLDLGLSDEKLIDAFGDAMDSLWTG
jgi:predicted regulator of Ras-like GTPase activity (Roadblock/LC7/MglB family)